jgi:hypothetical protein
MEQGSTAVACLPSISCNISYADTRRARLTNRPQLPRIRKKGKAKSHPCHQVSDLCTTSFP